MKQDTESTLVRARQTVLGVTTARVHNNAHGASMLIDGYMKESEVEGVQPAQAWAQLFAAAVLLMVPLLECRSDHHNQEMDDTLGELGIILAWDRRHQ